MTWGQEGVEGCEKGKGAYCCQTPGGHGRSLSGQQRKGKPLKSQLPVSLSVTSTPL